MVDGDSIKSKMIWKRQEYSREILHLKEEVEKKHNCIEKYTNIKNDKELKHLYKNVDRKLKIWKDDLATLTVQIAEKQHKILQLTQRINEKS